MRGFRDALEQDMRQEQELLELYEKELAALPKGGLRCYEKNGRVYFRHVWYREEGSHGTLRVEEVLDGKQVSVIEALQRKAFLKKAVGVLRKNLIAQRAAEDGYASYDPLKILECVGRANQPELLERFINQQMKSGKAGTGKTGAGKINAGNADGGKVNGGMPAEVKNVFRPEGLLQMTLAGFKVRSKSEALIANSLHENRIVFFYEKEIQVELENGEIVILHPDFAILLPSGELILWEHLGLLPKKDYALKFGEKLHYYCLAGYTPGVNLIITADDRWGGLDMQAIGRIIDWLKDIGMKRQ